MTKIDIQTIEDPKDKTKNALLVKLDDEVIENIWNVKLTIENRSKDSISVTGKIKIVEQVGSALQPRVTKIIKFSNFMMDLNLDLSRLQHSSIKIENDKLQVSSTSFERLKIKLWSSTLHADRGVGVTSTSILGC